MSDKELTPEMLDRLNANSKLMYEQGYSEEDIKAMAKSFFEQFAVEKPGKEDVVVEEDVVTATEEVSASGVGPLAPQEKDEFSFKEQIKKEPKAKEIKEVPSVFYDGIDLKEEEKVVEEKPNRITEINTEVEDASKRLTDYNQKLVGLASDIGVINQQLEYNPQYKNDTSYVANARAKYDEYQTLSKEARDLSEYYGNDLAGWRQTAMQSLPEYNEVIGEGVTKFDQDYFNKIENDINDLRPKLEDAKYRYGAAPASIAAMNEVNELNAQVKTLEKLKIDAIKRNTDINQFEFGSKYFLKGKEVSRSKLFEYLGSNEVIDLQNNDPSVRLPVKIVNDSYAQFVLDGNKKALETAEWVRPLKGFLAGAYDIAVKPIKGEIAGAMSAFLDIDNVAGVLGLLGGFAGDGFAEVQQILLDTEREAAETKEDVEDLFLRNYDTYLKENSEKIRGPQLYREQDVIDRALAGDYTGFVKGATKLSIESGAYLAAGMIPTVGPYIVANAMAYNSYYDLRREGVSKGRSAVASGFIGLIGLADQLNFNKLIRGTLAANTRIAATAASRGSQFTISGATKMALVKNSLKAIVVEPSTEFAQGFSESIANQWAKDKGINISEAMRDGAIEASASVPTSAIIAGVPGVQYIMLKNDQLKEVEALTKRMEGIITPDVGADALTIDEIKANKAEAAMLTKMYIQTFEEAEIAATKATREEFDAIATVTAEEAVLQRALSGRDVSPEQKAVMKGKLEKLTKKKEEALAKIEKRDIFGYEYDEAGNQKKDADGNPIKSKDRPRVFRNQAIIIDGKIPSELENITPSSTSKNANGETRNVYLGADLIDAGIAKGLDKARVVEQLTSQREANEEEIAELEKNTTTPIGEVEAEINALKEENDDLTKRINEIGGVENQIQTIKDIIANQDLSKVELLDFQSENDILKWAEKAFKDGLINKIDYINITKGKNRSAGGNGFMVRLAKQEGETDSDRKKVIIINKDAAALYQESNVASHEFLHTLLAKAISDNPSLIFSLKESFEKYLKEINPESLEKGEFRDRLQDYKNDPEKNKAEEFLTLFLDAMAGGHIKLKENLLVKLGDIFRRIIQSLGGKSVNVKFNTGKDVLNFIKDYNTSIDKGKLTTAQRNLFNEGKADVGGEIQSFSSQIATADTETQANVEAERKAEIDKKVAARAKAKRLAAKAEVKRKAEEARARKEAEEAEKPKTKEEIAKANKKKEDKATRKQEADDKKAARKKAKEEKEEANKSPKDIAKEISDRVTQELAEEEGGSLRASKASKLESLNLEFEKLDSEWNSGNITIDQFEAKEAAIEKKIADLESQPDDLEEEEEEVVTVKKEKPEKKETKKEKKPEGKKLSPDEAKEVEDNITEYQKESAENDELAAAANVSPQETSKMRKLGDAIDTSLKDTISSFAESQTKLLFDPIPNEARNGVTRSEFKETMISDIRAMVFREFKQGKQNIETFIVNRGFLRNKNLAKRLGIASVEEGITKDISDMKGITSDGGSNFDEQSDSEIELVMDAIEESKKIKLADKIFKGNEDIFEEALLAVEAGLDELPSSQRTFKGVPNMIAEQLAELVGVLPEQITNPNKAIQKSDVKGIVEFINTIKGDLLKTLPEGFVRSVGATANKDLVGTATGINEFRKIRDAFYEQREDPIEAPTKTGRVRTQAGLKPFSLRKNITMEEFLEFFQMDKSGNISPDVETIGSKGVSGAMKNTLNLVGKLITNQIIREFGDITPIERENILAGKASIMYSKADAELRSELEKPFPSTPSESAIKNERLAPNGNQSNLTDAQYDAVRTPAFKKWFGDWEKSPKKASQVVDENGEPQVVWRGRDKTKGDSGDILDISKTREGAFFADNERSSKLFMTEFRGLEEGEYEVIPAYLNIRNPEIFDSFDDFWDRGRGKAKDMRYVPSKGSDGAIIESEQWMTGQKMNVIGDGEQFIIFDSKQAKLADGSNTEFNPKDSSIRKSKISKGDLNLEFNEILENKSGISADKIMSKAQATNVGRGKGRFKFFIPPAAEDFMGLMYATLGKGKLGNKQMEWYKENLSDPYARAMRNISAARVAMIKRYNTINKALDISSEDLSNTIPGSIFTRDQAIRAHIWATLQMDIPGIDKADLKEMADFMDRNPRLKKYAKYLIALTAKEGYPKASEAWTAGNIKTDIIHSLNTDVRKTLLKDWKKNVDIIFSEENKNKLLAIYGKNYVDALTNSINRMTTGRNKPYKGGSVEDEQTNRFVDWINGQTGVIMFVNVKSAILQTISAANFVNMTDNNVIAAGKAFANQKQFWSDFTYLFNSDYLLERRNGLKMEISESELAEAARLNGFKGVRAKLLRAGFKPTQIADSFAIAFGGASFYRNRIATYKAEMEMDSNKKLVKKNTDADAEQFAFDDFREIAEESQQSSRPDKISQQQAGTLGRVVLAFANTPSQYARIMKKSFLDLKNGRGDAKTHIAKIMYYGFLQNIIFNTLQQAIFALAFDDEDDEKEKTKAIAVANGMLDSILRGIGVYGALIAAAKNTVMRIYAEGQEAQPDFGKEILRGVASFSPPIGSLASKIYRAGDIVVYEKDKIREEGFNITNPLYEAGAVLGSAFFNIPLDRLYTKAENVSYALSDSATDIESIALMAGWSKWSLGITEKEREAEKKQKEEEKKAEKKAKAEREKKQSKGGYKRTPRIRLNKTQKDKLKAQKEKQKAIEREKKKEATKWW